MELFQNGLLQMTNLDPGQVMTLHSMQLDEEQSKGVDLLLEKFNTLFSAGTQGFKQTHLTEYVIETVGIPLKRNVIPYLW